MRTAPRATGHTPTIERARHDLPDALGPMIPSPWPDFNWNATSCTTARLVPGGTTLTVPTAREWLGRGRAMRAQSPGILSMRSLRRRQLCRADTNPLHWDTASSTGASARDVRIDDAIMTPAVASCWIAR